MSKPRSRLVRRVVALLPALALVALVALPGACSTQAPVALSPTIASSQPPDIEVGPVTFYTRLTLERPGELSPDELQAILDAFEPYGDVRPVWQDEARTTLDVLVENADLAFAGSFIQEHFELAADGRVPWRLVSLRYRENLAARLSSFRLSGEVAPGVAVSVDIGDGFEPVLVDEQGRYELMVPFSARRPVAFVRTTVGEIERYGLISPGHHNVEPITREQYERLRRESIAVPDAAVEFPPQQPQTRPLGIPASNGRPMRPPTQTAPAGTANLSSPVTNQGSPGANTPASNGNDPDGPDGSAYLLPPLVLTRQVSVDVHLVIEGLGETDPLLGGMREALLPFNVRLDRYDPETGHYWFFCRVLDVDDIRRLHEAVQLYAREQEVPFVSQTRYLGAVMELVRLQGRLTTLLQGTIGHGATMELYLQPEGDSLVVEADDRGRFRLRLDSAGTIAWGVIRNPDGHRCVRFDVYSGAMDRITDETFELETRIELPPLSGEQPGPLQNETGASD